MTNSHDKPGLVSGKRVLLVTLLVCVVGLLPLVWVTLRWVESRKTPPSPLSWAQRDTWPNPPMHWTVLQKRPGPQPPFSSVRRNLDFQLPPDDQKTLQTLADLSHHLEQATSTLEQIAADHPDLFYARYLLARQQDDDALYQEAFALAPAVVKIRFADALDQPMAHLPLGTIQIVCAQLDDRVLDESLVLVYPDLVTDDKGLVYLPIYATPCRTSVLPQPPGYEAIYDWQGWFEFPHQTATLPTVQVRQQR